MNQPRATATSNYGWDSLWKKVRGFYSDHQGELNCEYVIDGNKLINSFLLGRSNEAA